MTMTVPVLGSLALAFILMLDAAFVMSFTLYLGSKEYPDWRKRPKVILSGVTIIIVGVYVTFALQTSALLGVSQESVREEFGLRSLSCSSRINQVSSPISCTYHEWGDGADTTRTLALTVERQDKQIVIYANISKRTVVQDAIADRYQVRDLGKVAEHWNIRKLKCAADTLPEAGKSIDCVADGSTVRIVAGEEYEIALLDDNGQLIKPESKGDDK